MFFHKDDFNLYFYQSFSFGLYFINSVINFCSDVSPIMKIIKMYFTVNF